MIYLLGLILLIFAVWCIQDIVIKVITLCFGVECAARIEKFREQRTRGLTADKIRYQAVIKYRDLNGREHTAVTTKLYEKWETECLVGRDVYIRYYQRDPEKFIMEKKELVKPIILLSAILIVPVLYLIANLFIYLKLIRTMLGIII